MPPQPLNSATVSGIDVIGTRWAVMAPSTPPASVPRRIQIQAEALIPVVARELNSRPSTARAMATAASWLAPRAERTLESPLMPSASSRTATSSMAY
jgi:hypothetical protein